MLGRCGRFAAQVAEAACRRFPLDWLWTGDDVASQRSLMISPATWRALVKPHLQRAFAVGKAHALAVAVPLLRRAAADHSRPHRDGARRAEPHPVQLSGHGRRRAETRVRLAS